MDTASAGRTRPAATSAAPCPWCPRSTSAPPSSWTTRATGTSSTWRIRGCRARCRGEQGSPRAFLRPRGAGRGRGGGAARGGRPIPAGGGFRPAARGGVRPRSSPGTGAGSPAGLAGLRGLRALGRYPWAGWGDHRPGVPRHGGVAGGGRAARPGGRGDPRWAGGQRRAVGAVDVLWRWHDGWTLAGRLAGLAGVRRAVVSVAAHAATAWRAAVSLRRAAP